MDYCRKIREEVFRAYNFKSPRTTILHLENNTGIGFTPIRSILPANPLAEYAPVECNMIYNMPDDVFYTLVKALQDYGKEEVTININNANGYLLKSNDMYIALSNEKLRTLH